MSAVNGAILLVAAIVMFVYGDRMKIVPDRYGRVPILRMLISLVAMLGGMALLIFVVIVALIGGWKL